jgi:predicted metal-dependent peptidase
MLEQSVVRVVMEQMVSLAVLAVHLLSVALVELVVYRVPVVQVMPADLSEQMVRLLVPEVVLSKTIHMRSEMLLRQVAMSVLQEMQQQEAQVIAVLLQLVQVEELLVRRVPAVPHMLEG